MSDERFADEASGPRERSTYSAFGDDYPGYDVRDEDKGKGPLILALAVGVILVFGAVIWNAYRQGTERAGNVPLITAQSDPFKRRPPEPGGTTTPNTDKRLFDNIDGRQRDDEVTPVQTREEPVDFDDAGAKVTPASQRTPGEPLDIRPGAKKTTSASGPSKPLRDVPVRETRKVETAPLPEARVRPPQPQPTLIRNNVDVTGNYLVQVAALRNQAAAEKIWSQLVEANPELFAGASLDIQRADLGARGIFYRVRAAAFGQRADASEFCDDLKRRDQNCIVVTR